MTDHPAQPHIKPAPPETAFFATLVGDNPPTSFASDWEQYWYKVGIGEGFSAGVKFGYNKAVVESYPELIRQT